MIPPERYSSLGELLGDALLQYKSETALIEISRKKVKRTLRFLDVKRQSERLARRLQDAGVGAGDRVAIVMSNQPSWMIAALAIFRRGGVLVPLDYKLEGYEQEALLQHCAPKVLITEYGEWRDLADLRSGALALPLVLVHEMPSSETLDERTERLEDILDNGELVPGEVVPRTREDIATVVYSSGTGGRPKGCLLTHDNYLEQYRSLVALYPVEVGDRYFSVLPTNHAIDFMCGFVIPFGCGAAVVHQRSLRPELIRHVLQEHGITHMALVPLILEAFERRLDEKLDEQSTIAQHAVEALRQVNAALTLKAPKHDLSRRLMRPVLEKLGPDLKNVFCGGAFVDAERAQRFYDLGLPVVIGYGTTEACTVITVNDLRPFRANSVGAPVEGVDVEIRNPSSADQRGVGEVWVRGRTVFVGYLDDPEQTAEVLQDGWLKTGDLGWLDPAGHLHLVGRSKNMIVTAGGKNIYPEDIEGAFEGLDCEELVVFATQFVWPGGELTDEALFAVVRPKDDTSADFTGELTRRNRKLPDFKRVAGVLEWTEEFPRTASMKIKRGELAEQLRAESARDSIRSLLN